MFDSQTDSWARSSALALSQAVADSNFGSNVETTGFIRTQPVQNSRPFGPTQAAVLNPHLPAGSGRLVLRCATYSPLCPGQIGAVRPNLAPSDQELVGRFQRWPLAYEWVHRVPDVRGTGQRNRWARIRVPSVASRTNSPREREDAVWQASRSRDAYGSKWRAAHEPRRFGRECPSRRALVADRAPTSTVVGSVRCEYSRNPLRVPLNAIEYS